VANFSVLPRVVTLDEVSEIRRFVEDKSLLFDDDPDSVDGMTSHEVFILSGGSNELFGQPKMNHPDPKQHLLRHIMRKRVLDIMQPIMDERITPFVRHRFPDRCGEDLDGIRRCTPCSSLVRRYRPGERRSHGAHYDSEAIVTVVISLSEYGDEYEGGLFLAAGSPSRRYVLPLSRGDAVVHKPDLLHGVQVEEGERWSWVLWYRDSSDCKDHSREWFEKCANEGDPICQGYYASSAASATSSREEKYAKMQLWHMKAAYGGFPSSMLKLARAYLKQLDSTLPFDAVSAAFWYLKGIKLWSDPDCYFGLAQMLIANQTQPQLLDLDDLDDFSLSTSLELAVRLLEKAAVSSHAYAAYNLGIAHLSGLGVPRPNATLSAEWFAQSGLPEGLQAVSIYHKAMGRDAEAAEWSTRAASLGYGTPWRERAMSMTGTGGANGVKLHSNWPKESGWCSEPPSKPPSTPPSKPPSKPPSGPPSRPPILGMGGIPFM
jgi:hypothetical protein